MGETPEGALSPLLSGRVRCSIRCSRCFSPSIPPSYLSRGNGHSCPFHPPVLPLFATREQSCDRPHGPGLSSWLIFRPQLNLERIMPRGDKSSYTAKQRRQARHIEEGYERRGVPRDEAERRAWATENAMSGGGRKSGSGRGRKTNKGPAKKGGRKGGRASARRSKAARSASARKAAATRKRKGGGGSTRSRSSSRSRKSTSRSRSRSRGSR
jgi:hypothetical protein